MTVAQRVVFAWLAVIVTLPALLFATLALGPLVRALFGVPAGFNGDFTSPVAYSQALFVQAVSVGIVDCGGSSRPFDYSPAVTIRVMSVMAIYRQLSTWLSLDVTELSQAASGPHLHNQHL